MRIYLLRHGTTDLNNAGIIPGIKPGIHLNQEGIERCERVALRLSPVPFARILSSPLERATRTAEIINRYHDLDIEIDKRLIDWDLGPWTGQSHQEISTQYPTTYQIWKEQPANLDSKEQEPLTGIAARMKHVVDDLKKLTDIDCVLLVSHRDPLAALMCTFVDAPLNSILSFHLQTACFAEWLYDGHRYVMHNFTNHA